MGETALVESKIADAIRLVEKLDADADPLSLAAWYFYDDADEWRLLLASPTFDRLLPKQELLAYRKLVDAMAGLGLSSLSVSDLKVVCSTLPLPQALRVLIRTGPAGIVRAHFTNITLNRIFIKQMVILRSA